MSAKTTQKGQKRQTNGKTTIRERLQKAIRRLVLLSIVSLVIVSMIMNHQVLSRLKADMQGDRKAVSGSDLSGINGIERRSYLELDVSAISFPRLYLHRHRSRSILISAWKLMEWSGEADRK